jgi:hypothetical protein
MEFKKLPIGHSDFKRIIEDDMFYVDKSLFIKEILNSGSLVSLLVRPRRFGKTLNLSMLKYFFEKHPNSQSSRHLFLNLKIEKEGEKVLSKCGRYPVIFFTFKDAKAKNWIECRKIIQKLISDEYERHSYLLENLKISDKQIIYFNEILSQTADINVIQNSLKFLSDLLFSYHKERVIILIDEYDTPIHESIEMNYYDDIINFYRLFLGAGLKDNSSIEKGIITGILRISKESIFSDLNHLDVYTILNRQYSDKFGLTQSEVFSALDYYQLESHKEGVKMWYNGYTFGDHKDIYNPWSILNFIDKSDEGLIPHWINTSSNLLVKKLLTNADIYSKSELESLMQGESIQKEIIVDTVFSDIEKNSNTLWSFLLFSGYLNSNKSEINKNSLIYDLKIPNLEVEYIYKRFSSSWLSENLYSDEISLLLKALLSGNVLTFEEILQKFVVNSMSYFDPTGKEPERIYHAFVLGILLQLSDTHRIKSNRESGYGRYDILLIPKKIIGVGIILEFKKVNPKKSETLESSAESALLQINEREYEMELREIGTTKIFKYGIAFDGKEIFVKLG